VYVLAPAEMQHPTEYELNIDDVDKIRHAELIVCGGYEIMMDRIREGLKIGPERILEIKTDYNMEHIRSSVQAISAEMGTGETAEENIREIEILSGNQLNRSGKPGSIRDRCWFSFSCSRLPGNWA
jgi:ABC-type Zn uptake system ZnuABC Zn-binding protein ZnuA